MRVERAGAADAQAILDLQKLAYRQEAAIYDDYTIAPLHQTLAEMEGDLRQQVVLKVVVEGRIVGSVRATARDDTCFVGRLIVHPDFQDRGIGTRLLAEIEAYFEGVRRYELFTGHRSEKNLHLYDKVGYRPLCTRRLSDRLTLVYLEKTNAVQACTGRV
ncbi:MAG TPA: GNAT family N-acetyltransferase [Anaerolineae bacterium]|nr:GNAT family N-acetyltransferase [Anaerolineae bacterium]